MLPGNTAAKSEAVIDVKPVLWLTVVFYWLIYPVVPTSDLDIWYSENDHYSIIVCHQPVKCYPEYHDVNLNVAQCQRPWRNLTLLNDDV